MANGNYDLVFDGEDDYIEIADSADFSAATTGQLSVSAWIRARRTDISGLPEHGLCPLDGQR